MRIAEPDPTSGTATMRMIGEPNEAAPDAEAEAERPAASSHVVQAGDHLWAIAETHLADHLGRAPTDAEVVPYWQGVIAANPQVTNPDLIYPGQTLVVPSPA